MHQIDVVAADIRERIRLVGSTPVLEIRIPVIPLLHQPCGAQTEVTETPFAIAASRSRRDDRFATRLSRPPRADHRGLQLSQCSAPASLQSLAYMPLVVRRQQDGFETS